MTRKIQVFQTIEELKPTLKPPVANSMMFNDGIKVMVVGGPNQRKDFHIEMGEELFYQVQGAMDVIIDNPHTGKQEAIHIREGDVFLLPAGIPHSPQRYANTIGIVFERDRATTETDCLRWYKDDNTVLYEEFFYCADLGSQIKQAIGRFQDFLTNGTPPPPTDPNLTVQDLLDCMANAKNTPLLPPCSLNEFISTHQGESTIFDSEFVFKSFTAQEGQDTSSYKVHFLPQYRELYLWQHHGNATIRFVSGESIEMQEGDGMILSAEYHNQDVEIVCHGTHSTNLLVSIKFP